MGTSDDNAGYVIAGYDIAVGVFGEEGSRVDGRPSKFTFTEGGGVDEDKVVVFCEVRGWGGDKGLRCRVWVEIS